LLKRAETAGTGDVDARDVGHREGAVDAEVSRIASENMTDLEGPAAVDAATATSVVGIDQMGDPEV
jgi:hypothetical protein